MIKRILLLYLSFKICLAYELETFYGKINYESKVIYDSLNHRAFKRLEYINQYGSTYYSYHKIHYTRASHCVGVWYLLAKFGASLEEQLAGLWHDASHTVFSHVGDVFFDHDDGQYSYQDTIHLKYLKHVELDELLAIYDITLEDIDPKAKQYKMLEADLPDICADRLEYNLQGGYVDGLLSKDDIKEILNNIKFENNNWFFTDVKIARKFADISLYLTENVWGSPKSSVIYKLTSQVLKQAIKINILKIDDILYSQDDIVWNILLTKGDDKIKNILKNIMHNYRNLFIVERQKDCKIYPKFRGIDPWIKTQIGLQRLTVLDAEFAVKYENLRDKFKFGISYSSIKI